MSIDFSDQNLLFAVVMLRHGFVDESQFVSVLNQWSDNKTKNVSDLVIANGWLEDMDASAIDRLVQRQIQNHGDIQQSISHHAQTMDFSSCEFADENVRRLLDSSTFRSAGAESSVAHGQSEATPHVPRKATSARSSSATDVTMTTDSNPAKSRPDSKPELSLTSPSGSGSKSQGPGDNLKSGEAASHSRFSVIRPYAKGGLGKVSIALDKELDREVALKEIRSRYAHDPMSRDRFVLEACITGGLEHPGVVPVYGFGKKTDGSPYFAMRLIKGQTLKQAIVDYHEKYNGHELPEQRLEFRNMLNRFVDACNAIAYAHNRGVIHRDIKPSNIMLGKYGETLVVDWGLAKKIGREAAQVDEDSSLSIHGSAISGTLDGSTVGTPTFMSPEQAEGRLEEMRPASDIYSLGSTLYFLLTGQTAFTGPTAAEVVALVAKNEFVPPRERVAHVPPALNAICCKAMATRPADRYKTALMLAADIENWLADEPVAAHRESLLAKTGRWLRHHKTLATSAAVLALTVTIASLFGMLLVNAEKNRTVAAKRKTEQALAELEQAQLVTETALTAETNARRQTREALNTITDDLVGEMMARQVELGDADRKFFARVLNQFEEFTNTPGESAEAMNIRADGYFRVGNLQRRLDDLEAAAQAYDKAEEIWTSLAKSKTDPDYRLDLAAVTANHAILLSQQGNHQEALDKENKAATLLDGLIQEFPENSVFKVEYASLLGNRGNAYARLGQPTKAEADYKKSIELYDSLSSPSDDAKLQKARAQAISFLAGLYAKQKDKLQESESRYREVIKQLAKLVSPTNAEPEFERQLAIARQNLGRVLLAQDRKDDAIEQFREAVKTQVSLTNKYPALAAYRLELGRSRLSLGQALNQLGLAGGDEELQAAQALTGELVNAFPERIEFKSDLASVYDQLGTHYRTTSPTKARDMFQQGIDLRKKIQSLDPQNKVYADQAIAAEINFANFLRLSDDPDNAAQRYQAVLKELDSQESSAANLVRATVFGLGDSLVKAKRYDEALECWTRLAKNTDDPAWKTFELQRAICAVRTGKVDEGTQIAAAVLSQEEPDGLTCYDVGCCYAVGAQIEPDKTKADALAKQAVELLGRAGANNFFNDEMKKHASSDVDLQALRGREDFREICIQFGIPLEPVVDAPKDGF